MAGSCSMLVWTAIPSLWFSIWTWIYETVTGSSSMWEWPVVCSVPSIRFLLYEFGTSPSSMWEWPAIGSVHWMFYVTLDLWIYDKFKFHMSIDLSIVSWHWGHLLCLCLCEVHFMSLVGLEHGMYTMLYEPDLCPCCCAVMATCWVSKPLWKCVIPRWIGNAACVCESV